MKKLLRALGSALFACAVLAGCATMDADDCRKADWRAIGLQDGQAGEPPGMLDRRREDCAKAGFATDTARYAEGRAIGLQQYCRLEQAARLGLEGKPYQGVCPPGIDAEFRRLHAVGWEVHQARENLRSVERQMDGAESRLRKADKEDDRRKIRDELRRLDGEMRRARARVRDAEWNFDRLR